MGSSFFTALNNGLISAILSFLRTIVFQISCVLILPIFFDLNGIWISVVVAEALSALFSVVFICSFRKKYNY